MRDYPVFAVAPVHEGKLLLSSAQKKIVSAYMRKHDGETVRMQFSQPTKNRSNAQNRYYWSVILLMIAAETGHTTEEIHEYMKAMLLPRVFLKVGTKDQQLTKSTTTLSTFDMEEYLEAIRIFAATELQLTIPLPHESL